LTKIPDVNSLIQSSDENEVWSNICEEKPNDEGMISHQVFPIPIGILHEILSTQDNSGDINCDTLYTLCILILELVREKEDFKSSAYIKEVIYFLVIPIHLKEKKYESIKHSGFMLKKVTGTEVHFKTSITAIKKIVDDLIESIPKPTSDIEDFEPTDPKALPEEEEEAVTEETLTKIENLDLNDNDQGLVDCLNDRHVSNSSPRIPKKNKSKRAASPPREESSESEEESDDEDSDDDDSTVPLHKSRKSSQPATKRIKMSKTPKVAPIATTNNLLAPQQQFINATDFAQVFEHNKSYLHKMTKRNSLYIRMRTMGRSNKLPTNISKDLQDVLEQCRKTEDIPCELYAALRDKCRELGVHFNLLPLDKKFCERIMTPSASHDGSMISSISEITGFSPTGFIGKGTKYVMANGQKVGTPATVNQLLDMIGHTWAYTRIERKKSIIASKYESLFAGLRHHESQLRVYFDKGGEAFGNHVMKLIHNSTTDYLSGCYEGRPFSEIYCLTFDFEIVQKIALNTYPQIMKQNGRGRDEGNAHRGRGKSQGSSGGYQGGTNQYNQNDNFRQTSNKKRGTGQGPFIYNGPKGQLNKFLGKDAISRMGDNLPKDNDDLRLCFNCFIYEKCTFSGCRFSHKISENVNKIDTWMKANNLPFKKRE